MIDGEIVAFDQEGRPSFNALQNYGSAPAPVVYYVFDVMVLASQNVMRESLSKRRELLEKKVLPRLAEPIRYSAPHPSHTMLIAEVAVKETLAASCHGPQQRESDPWRWMALRLD